MKRSHRRTLTVRNRLDTGNLEDSLEVLGTEVADTERDTLEGTVKDQVLEVGPELGNGALLGHVGVVDEEEVRLGAETLERLDDRLADVGGSGGLGGDCKSAWYGDVTAAAAGTQPAA